LRVLGDFLAGVIAWVVGDVLRVRRAHVEAAMARAGIRDVSRRARAMYRTLARGLLEFLSMMLRPESQCRRVVLPDAAISEIRARGRGAIVATAHTGNWDLAACAMAGAAPLSIVTKRLHVRLLDVLWQGARQRRGVKLLGVGGAGKEALKALRRGEFVAMLIDQAPERSRSVVRIRFLGGHAWVDLAPALMAMRARAPFVVAFPVRLRGGSHAIEVAKILEPPRTPSGSWAAHAMGEATRALERFVMDHPEQWLWMHRRWKPLPMGCTEPQGATP
jgi:Kdo2-lipid IVA lauroyltransferase/acyltransferase